MAEDLFRAEGEPPDVDLLLLALSKEGRSPEVISMSTWRALNDGQRTFADWLVLSDDTLQWWAARHG